MITFSPCKINIGLDIVSKREDGYHNIVTAMVPVPWTDIVEVVPSDTGVSSLSVLGNPVDCPAEKNLAMRAFRAMEAEYGIGPATIVLRKIVPDGAGLGGGSSDAASVILLCNQVFGLGLSKEEMARVASKIGADCPFFIYERPMLATGIGTTLEPIDMPWGHMPCLIAKPLGVSVSTKEAYAGVKPSIPERPLPQLLELPVDQWQRLVKNDFEPGIFRIAPQVKAIKDSMLEHGATYSSMSGSGSAVFGLFPSLELAESCRKSLANCVTWAGEL